MALRSLDDLIDKKKAGGKWKINDRHEIQYWSVDDKSTATIKATILDVKPAALVLQYTQKEDDQRTVTRIYELNGTWRVDPKNRITFIVEKETGKRDVLTFRNIWTINENHELEYSFEEAALKTKEKQLKKLTFNGFWDINERSRITYSLGKDSSSYFRFRGAFQTKSILAKKDEIRYQVGVEFEKRIKTQTITLFGKWKYSDKYGLTFEIEYKDGRKHAIRFGADYSITAKDHIELKLVNIEGQSLGVELLLTRDFLKRDGQAFVKLLKNAEESRVEGGVSIKW